MATPQDPIFTRWVENYPYGLPGEMTCNEAATILYAAEGGGIAFLNPETGVPGSMEAPLKRVRVGREGVRASNMSLDPDAVVPADPTVFVPGPANLVYIAGGRHGLWAMDADPRAGTSNLAVRLDDSGSDVENGNQNSRRWCNDVGFFSILKDGDTEPTDYLVALFAKKRNNRLRVYELDAARQAFSDRVDDGLDLSFEHGHELQLGTDGFSLKVQKNASVVPLADVVPPPPQADLEVDFAYAMDMAVDQVSATEAHIYVALGMHGIVRVVLDEPGINHHLDPLVGQPVEPFLEDGPYFGDGSPYVAGHSIYGHLALYEANEDSTLAPVLRHYERPLFMGVAVQNFGGQHALFAAVDHLGWVKFSLTGSHSFGPLLPIAHHEGTIIDASPIGFPAFSTEAVALSLDGSAPELSYASDISVHEVTDDSTTKALVTVVAGEPHGRLLEGVHNEGRVLNWVGNSEGKINKKTEIPGVGPRTFLYLDGGNDLLEGALVSSSVHLNSTIAMSRGGFFAHAPGAQDTDNYLMFLGKFVLRDVDLINSVERLRVDFDDPLNPAKDLIPRGVEFRPGRFSPYVGTLPDHPETVYDERQVVISGINDESIPYGDLLYLESGDTLAETVAPDSNGGGFGGWFQDQAIWIDDSVPGEANYWSWAAARYSGESWFSLKLFQVGASGTAPTWTTVKEYLIPAPQDMIFTRDAYYAGGYVNEEFNAELGEEFLFVTLSGNRQSLYLLDRGHLTAAIGDAEAESLDASDVESIDLGAVHLECREMPPSLSSGLPLVRDRAHSGAVGALNPRLVKIGARWTLAVPGWTMVIDPNDNVVGQYATTNPTWRQYSKMFVRFYDVTGAADLLPAVLDRPTIVGPGLESTALHVEYLQVDGATYLFVGDFMGKLWVFDVSSMGTTLSESADDALDLTATTFASWELAKSFSDDLAQNLAGLTIDTVVEGTETRHFVYVSGWRLGTRVLEFLPDTSLPQAQRLQDLDLIQGAFHLSQIRIREDVAGSGRRAFIADNGTGFLVLEEQ